MLDPERKQVRKEDLLGLVAMAVGGLLAVFSIITTSEERRRAGRHAGMAGVLSAAFMAGGLSAAFEREPDESVEEAAFAISMLTIIAGLLGTAAVYLLSLVLQVGRRPNL